MQKKPLEMLKYLVSHGGREVSALALETAAHVTAAAKIANPIQTSMAPSEPRPEAGIGRGGVADKPRPAAKPLCRGGGPAVKQFLEFEERVAL